MLSQYCTLSILYRCILIICKQNKKTSNKIYEQIGKFKAVLIYRPSNLLISSFLVEQVTKETSLGAGLQNIKLSKSNIIELILSNYQNILIISNYRVI